MLAFTQATIPFIMASVDFLNIMTYDLMNRRDNITKHHTGIQNSIEAIDAYLSAGVPSSRANLGLAFYVKWFKTDFKAREECKKQPLGCKAALMEDPTTGADLGKAGAFAWHDRVPSELEKSFADAVSKGMYEDESGGYYYFDPDEDLFWSWDTEEAITRKFSAVVEKKGLGGAFAWGLGEDAGSGVEQEHEVNMHDRETQDLYGFKHLQAANEEIMRLKAERMERSEL